MNDFAARAPLVLFSTEGGMDIEEVAARNPASIRKRHIPIDGAFGEAEARELLAGCDLGNAGDQIAIILAQDVRGLCRYAMPSSSRSIRWRCSATARWSLSTAS